MPTILCVNLNAAVDRTVVVDGFRLGHIHRPEAVTALAGGKGANVARALQRFGADPTVLGWAGGSAGHFIERELDRESIVAAFVHVDFESRTCLSVVDRRTQTVTEIYEKGEPIPAPKVEEMLDRFRELIGSFAAVTLSGSLPPGVPADFYGQLVEMARAANVPAFLDSSGEALRQGAAAGPFLIKPNKSEVAALGAGNPASPAAFARVAATLAARYDTIAVLSLGKEGAVAAAGDERFHVQNPAVAAHSAVGSGDCLLAGVAYAVTAGLSLPEAVRYGVAAGTANTLRVGAGRFRLRDFHDIHARTTLQPLAGPGEK